MEKGEETIRFIYERCIIDSLNETTLDYARLGTVSHWQKEEDGQIQISC